MNYAAARYNVFWGYGAADLSHWAADATVAEDAINCLLDELAGASQLVVKANLFVTPSGVTSTRKAKYRRGATLHEILARARGCTECGIYIYDAAFSPVTPPHLLVNFHSGAAGEIAGRALMMPDGSTKAGTFLICGVALGAPNARRFTLLARETSRALGISYAYIFHDVAYSYDGVTPLEWAYKNHSAKLRSGKLSDLAPAGGEALQLGKVSGT